MYVGIGAPESKTIMVTPSKQTGQTENNNNNKKRKHSWRWCVVVSAETGKSTIKQTNMHTLVCSCHCGTVIYFTSPVIVVVPYCQLSWCLRGNLCKSSVQLWHLETANAHGACSCHKLRVRTHTHKGRAYGVQVFLYTYNSCALNDAKCKARNF